MRMPKAGYGDDLDQHTQTYVDIHIALDCLHMRYPEYIRQTTQDERQLYSLYYALKYEKDEHAMERQRLQAEMERVAQQPMARGYKTTGIG